MLSTEAIDRMTVKKLQAELQKHGAATRGTKAELKARLAALLEESTAPAESEDAPASDCNMDAPANDVPSPTTEPPLPANETSSAASEPSKPVEPTAAVKPEATATNESHESADDQAHATTMSDVPMAAEPHALPTTTPDAAASSTPEAAASATPDGTAAPPAKKRKVEETPAVVVSVPPAKNPVSCTLRIDNFVRPFTLPAVHALVQADGAFVEDHGFWIDSIKTHCYVTFSTPEIATATRERLHGVVWPAHHGKTLSVDYSASTAKAIATANPVPELRRRPTLVASVGKPTAASLPAPPVTMDDLFWKTTTKPVLYYLPLTSEQVALRQTSAVATTTTTSL